MAIPEPTTAPVVHLVPLKDIKLAKWNPASRVSEKRLVDLRLSVDDLGLYYPLLLDKQKNLIDGHRRYAVIKSFGWKRAPCITIDEPHDASYGSVQLTQQRLTGHDRIGVYLIEPKALMGKQRARIKYVEDSLGHWALELLYKTGQTTTVFVSAQRAIKYVEGHLDMPTLFKWIVKHRMTMVHILLKGGMSPSTLIQAVKKDKPINIDDTD